LQGQLDLPVALGGLGLVAAIPADGARIRLGDQRADGCQSRPAPNDERDPSRSSDPASSMSDRRSHHRDAPPGGHWPSSSGDPMNTGTTGPPRCNAAASAG